MDNPIWATGIGLVSVLMEGRVTAQLRAEIQSEIMQQRQSGTLALLNSLYDAVVEMDSDLQIIGDMRPLAQFFLRNGLPMGSQNFLDLIMDADKELASARLHQCLGSRQSMAEVMHLRMRAGNGHAMQVEAFGIYYWGLGGGHHFMMGLRELGETQDPESRSPQSVDAAGTQGPSTGWLPKEAEAVIESSEDGCPIRWSSPGFEQLIGGVPAGFSFLKLVDKPRTFIKWLQACSNLELQGESDSEYAVPRPLELVLRPRFARNREHFRTLCQVATVSTEHSTAGHFDPDIPILVRLTFGSLAIEPARLACASCSDSPSSSSSSFAPVRQFKPDRRGTQQQPDQAHTGCLSTTLLGRPMSL